MSDIADKIYAATGLTLGAEEAAKIGQMIQVEAADRIAELEAALREIASGRYSNVALPTHPPQDPAVVRARAALERGER